jgi:hypothetical protein
MDALPNAAIVSFTNTAVASTRGYDELIPYQLSPAKEMRLYRMVIEEFEGKERVFIGETGKNGVISLAVKYESRSEDDKTVEIRGSWDNWQQAIELQ